MKYLLLVSHGQLAAGLRSALDLFGAKGRTDVLYACLADGMGVPDYVEELKRTVSVINPEEDEVVLLGDLHGGSPLTNAMNLFYELGMSDRVLTFAGMNLPSALNALFNMDDSSLEELEGLIPEDTEVHKVVLELDDEDEDEEDL